MPDTLTHLTLTTGHVCPSPRADVADDVIATLRPIVRRGHGVVRGLRIYHGGVVPGGRWFTLSWHPAGAWAVYCVCCWDPTRHNTWWHRALEHWTSHAVVEPRHQVHVPPVPWLTAEILPAALDCSPHQMDMLGDAERCVAWTLIEEARDA